MLAAWVQGVVAATPSAAVAAVPTLGPEVRAVLDAADDDTDRLGEPVAVVLDLVRSVGGLGAGETRPGGASRGSDRTPEGDVGSPAGLDVAGMLEDPEAWRGRLVRVVGRLEQAGPRPAAGADVREWFVRAADGPVAVLLVDAPAAGRPGRTVQVDGWVIRRAAAEARDGVRRRYPLIVAAPGRVRILGAGAGSGAGDGGGGAGGLALLAAGVAGGAMMLMVVRRLARRRRGAPAAASATFAARRARRERRREGGVDEAARVHAGRPSDADPTLPPDAADALAALRSRAADASGAGRDDEPRSHG